MSRLRFKFADPPAIPALLTFILLFCLLYEAAPEEKPGLVMSVLVAARAELAAVANSLPMENSEEATPRLIASYDALRLEDRLPGTSWVAAMAWLAAWAMALELAPICSRG